MSTPNPFEVAAIPSAIAILKAAQGLIQNLGTDPAQIAAKFPGAVQVFLGTVEMQLPILATSEVGALNATAGTRIANWIASLEQLVPAK